jgi:hypothetical protein
VIPARRGVATGRLVTPADTFTQRHVTGGGWRGPQYRGRWPFWTRGRVYRRRPSISAGRRTAAGLTDAAPPEDRSTGRCSPTGVTGAGDGDGCRRCGGGRRGCPGDGRRDLNGRRGSSTITTSPPALTATRDGSSTTRSLSPGLPARHARLSPGGGPAAQMLTRISWGHPALRVDHIGRKQRERQSPAVRSDPGDPIRRLAPPWRANDRRSVRERSTGVLLLAGSARGTGSDAHWPPLAGRESAKRLAGPPGAPRRIVEKLGP